MTRWQLFVCADFAVAVVVAFVSGYLTARRIWFERGYRAGTSWAHRARRYFDDKADPTAVESRR